MSCRVRALEDRESQRVALVNYSQRTLPHVYEQLIRLKLLMRRNSRKQRSGIVSI